MKPSNCRIAVVRRRRQQHRDDDGDAPPFKNAGIGVSVYVIRNLWEECNSDSSYRHDGSWLNTSTTTGTCFVTSRLPNTTLCTNKLVSLLVHYCFIVGARHQRMCGMVILKEADEKHQKGAGASVQIRIMAVRSIFINADSESLMNSFARQFTAYCDKHVPGAIVVSDTTTAFPPNTELTLEKRYSAEPNFHAFPFGPEPRSLSDVPFYVDECDD